MVDASLVIGGTVVFIAIMAFLGYLGWRKTKSGEEFLLAGKNVNP